MDNQGIIPEEILRQRASLYASNRQEEIQDVIDQLLVFCLESQWFGISMKMVEKIESFRDCLFIPRTKPTILGLVNILGNFLPVVDIRQLLHLPPLQTVDRNTCSFVVVAPSISFIADEITGVASVSSSSVVFQDVSQEKSAFIRSIVEVKINNVMYQVAWLKNSICEEIL